MVGCLLLATTVLFPVKSIASETTAGTDFYLAFARNLNAEYLGVFITASSDTSGTISSASFDDIPFTVGAGTVEEVRLPASFLSEVGGHASGVVVFSEAVIDSYATTALVVAGERKSTIWPKGFGL